MDAVVAALRAAHGDKAVVLMSNTGGSDGPQAGRCKYVAIYLVGKRLWPHEKVLRLQGGITAWVALGLPLVKPPPTPR